MALDKADPNPAMTPQKYVKSRPIKMIKKCKEVKCLFQRRRNLKLSLYGDHKQVVNDDQKIHEIVRNLTWVWNHRSLWYDIITSTIGNNSNQFGHQRGINRNKRIINWHHWRILWK